MNTKVVGHPPEFNPQYTSQAFVNFFKNGVIIYNDTPALIQFIQSEHSGDVDDATKIRLVLMTDKEGGSLTKDISAKEILNWQSLAWPELGYVAGGPNILYWTSRNHAQVQQKAISSQTLSVVVPEPAKALKSCLRSKDLVTWGGHQILPDYKWMARWLKWAPIHTVSDALTRLFSGQQAVAVVNRGTALIANPYKDGDKYPVLILHHGITVGRFDTNEEMSFVEDVEIGELW